MNKVHFLLLLTALFFFSCKKKGDDANEKTTGDINTISVLIDDQLWKGEIGDTIRNKFASSVIGLPQEEPQFTINQYPIKFLEGYVVNSRNSIVIKKGASSEFEIKKNEFDNTDKRAVQQLLRDREKLQNEVNDLKNKLKDIITRNKFRR